MKNIVLKGFGLLLRVAQILIITLHKKRSNHIILGSSAGTNINGNSKALFLYMYNNNTALKPYFITRNYTLYKSHTKSFPGHLLYAYSIRALVKVITTRAFVLTHGTYDVTPFKCVKSGVPLINVWHGFPIKKLGTDSHFLSIKQKRKVLGDFDGLVVMSEEERQIMSNCYHTPLENTWVTGYPRNDLAFIKNEAIIDQIPFIRGKKVLLYAPTFRDSGKTELFPFPDFDKDRLNAFLEKNNIVMLLRIHKNELIQHNLKENEWIKICDGNVVQEINEIMSVVDILITDYSSSYIDGLLVDIPYIFIPYDLDWFANYRGLNFNYNEVTPGPKVADFGNFLIQIKRYLDDPEADKDRRDEIKKRFHKYHDNHSSSRVYNRIENLVNVSL